MFVEKKAKELLSKMSLMKLYEEMELVSGEDSDEMSDKAKEEAIDKVYTKYFEGKDGDKK